MRLAIILAILFGAHVAHAYPQFMFSHGDDTCQYCHVSWAGGGAITNYGRDASAASISRGGSGAFLHGLWEPPDWLTIGGDFRFATGDKQLPEQSNEVLVFPMQMDLSGRVTKGKFSFTATLGVRGGGARDDPQPKFVERLVSREHYLSYAGEQYSIRVGRFFPFFGLRVVDHTSFIRRYMGSGLLEEPYAVEVTRDFTHSSLHVTGFIPNTVPTQSAGQQGYGGTIDFERRYDTALLGAQAKVSLSPQESRYAIGATAHYWMPESKLHWMAELDLQRQVFARGAPGRSQIAGYLGVSRWLARGWLLGGAMHLWEPDLTLPRDSREAAEVTLEYFPRAHFELNLLVRGILEGTNADDPGFLSLLQFHYYL